MIHQSRDEMNEATSSSLEKSLDHGHPQKAMPKLMPCSSFDTAHTDEGNAKSTTVIPLSPSFLYETEIKEHIEEKFRNYMGITEKVVSESIGALVFPWLLAFSWLNPQFWDP